MTLRDAAFRRKMEPGARYVEVTVDKRLLGETDAIRQPEAERDGVDGGEAEGQRSD